MLISKIPTIPDTAPTGNDPLPLFHYNRNKDWRSSVGESEVDKYAIYWEITKAPAAAGIDSNLSQATGGTDAEQGYPQKINFNTRPAVGQADVSITIKATIYKKIGAVDKVVTALPTTDAEKAEQTTRTFTLTLQAVKQ